MATHQDLPQEKTSIASGSYSTGGSIGSPENQNLIAAVAYLGGPVTGVAILILEKTNSYIRFHAMQSTIFSSAIIFANIALGFLPLGNLGFLFGQFLTMTAFVIWIVLLYKAFNGERYELPYLGPIARSKI